MYWLSTRNMTAIFYILGFLLVLNALLLTFSVNGSRSLFKRPTARAKENRIPSILEPKIAEAEYKKAV